MAGAPEPLLRVVVPGGCSGNVDRVSPEPLPSFDDDPRVGRTVLTEAQLTERIAELGRELTEAYRGERPLLVCVLRGAYAFLTDLARCIDLPVEIDFIAVSSYGASTRTSGVVRLV
jgi:hypoxanthine phosphoribosyltransferase